MREQVLDGDGVLAVPLETGQMPGHRIAGGKRMAPSSTSAITLGVVATTFVSDARSKMVSAVIGSRAGRTDRWPNALR